MSTAPLVGIFDSSGQPVAIAPDGFGAPHGVMTFDLTSGQPSSASKGALATSGVGSSGLVTVTKKVASIASTLPKYVAGLKRAQRRAGPCIVLALGDSTTAGLGANTAGGSGFILGRKMNYPSQLAKMLGWRDSAVFGIPCQNSCTVDQFDERISAIGAGWTAATPYTDSAYLGGGLVNFTAGAAGAYTITPKGDRQGFDRVRIYKTKHASGGASSLTVNVAGSSIGTLNFQAGSDGVEMVELTCPYSQPGTPISFTNPVGGIGFIAGVLWYDSTDPGVIVVNGGASSASQYDLVSTSNAFTTRALAPVLAPDLTLLDIWINDSRFATPPATYQANLTTAASYLTPSGDIVYMGFQPINDAAMTNGAGAAIFAAIQAVAGSAPVVDWRTVFTDYATANAAGWMFDSLHPTSFGYHAKAGYLASLITP